MKKPVGRTLVSLAFVASVVFTLVLPRSDWPLILAPYAIAFLIYGLICSNEQMEVRWIKYWILVGVTARLAAVFVFPNLSDDIFRFIWDGHLTLSGINPYSVLPSQYLLDHGETGVLTSELLSQMNSPDYFTVYPPISQALFAFAAFFGGANLVLNTIVLKMTLLAAEITTIILMYKHFKRSRRAYLVLLYALNPLVIIELVGNVHFESLMITGLVLAITSLSSVTMSQLKKALGVATGLILAVGVKLLPVIFLPLIFRRVGIRQFVMITVLFTAGTLILFIPVLITDAGLLDSLGLYFQAFEFNASFYYVLRWFGYLWKGYNMIATIGVLTSILVPVLLIVLFFTEKNPSQSNWARACLLALTIYFAFASIVHPWYVCPLVAVCCFTNLRYPIAWSAVAFVSYSAYSGFPYQENLWLVGIEYLVVLFVALYEFSQPRASKHNIETA